MKENANRVEAQLKILSVNSVLPSSRGLEVSDVKDK